jgi:tetratricopeptide (TPR) repeat protein
MTRAGLAGRWKAVAALAAVVGLHAIAGTGAGHGTRPSEPPSTQASRPGKTASTEPVGQLTSVQLRQLAEADVLKRRFAELYRQGRSAEAVEPAEQCVRICREALGEQHPEYATSLNNLAALHESMGDYARAEPLHRQAMEICREALGEHDPYYAANLNNLAMLYQSMGDYPRAEPLHRQAMEIRRKALGGKHPWYATSLNNLGLQQLISSSRDLVLDQA